MEAEDTSKLIVVWVAQQPSRSGIPSQSKSQTRCKGTILEKSLHYPVSVPARNLNKLAKKHGVVSLRLCSPPENGPWYVHIVLWPIICSPCFTTFTSVSEQTASELWQKTLQWRDPRGGTDVPEKWKIKCCDTSEKPRRALNTLTPKEGQQKLTKGGRKEAFAQIIEIATEVSSVVFSFFYFYWKKILS